MLVALDRVDTFGSMYEDRTQCLVKYRGNTYWAYFDQLSTKWYRPGCYFIDEELLNDDTLAHEGFEDE